MPSDKKRRIANAVGFVSGVFACLDALRDGSVFWPPDEVWQSLRGPQRIELGGGLILIVITLVSAVVRREILG